MKSYYYKLLVLLNTEHHKKGKEFLFDIQEYDITKTSYRRIGTKDLESRNEENNINTIGNTLVNILNNKDKLLDVLNTYYAKVDNEKDLTRELIKSINQFYIKNGLVNIENNTKEQIYNNINSAIKIYKSKEDSKEKLSLEKQYKKLKDIYIKEYGTSKEFEQIYKFITELIKLPNFLNYYGKNYIDTRSNKWILAEKYGIDIMKQYYKIQTERLLNNMCLELNHIFRMRRKQFSFIINYFIKQFINDLDILYKSFNNKYISLNKHNIIEYFERLKATNTEIPYIADVIKYCNKSYNSVEFLNDITKIFINSLKKELTSIFDIFEIEEHTSTKTLLRTYLKIPKSIMFDNTSTKVLEKLNISKLADNTVGYIYDINNLADLLNVTLYSLKMDNKVISKCKNCNRYFISNKKNTEIFCRRIDPKTQKQVSCIKIGRQVNRTAIDNEVKNIYHKIYNRLCNENVYTNNERQKFQNEYKQKIEELKESEHDKTIWQEDLKEWLIEQEEKTRNKNYLNKYGKVGRTKDNL